MEKIALLPELVAAPAVFAVGENYQIMALVSCDTLFYVQVADQTFYDHTNGVMRTLERVHSVTVPMALLDAAGGYTVFCRQMLDRKPYFPETGELHSATYPFRPVPKNGPVHLYHLADTHGNLDMPVAAASYFGDALDLLILNGDIPDHSGNVEHFALIYQLADAITYGQRATVFSRGNHDMRGYFAEQITAYSPTDHGNSYFTFRVGNVWGMVLDCGEDKPDGHDAYGYTNVGHTFRLAQTAFIKRVIENAEREYAAAGITHRLVIAHNPFTYTHEAPFDIEYDTYTEWAELLARHVRPHALIAGHLHTDGVRPQGGELDKDGQIPVIIGSYLRRDEAHRPIAFRGAAITLSEGEMLVELTDHTGAVALMCTLPC
ncbi:MAG: metallophosphoesterase [Clostridia bacterium]|nr:metallophosphoesterase [Clostridia bacterium]